MLGLNTRCGLPQNLQLAGDAHARFCDGAGDVLLLLLHCLTRICYPWLTPKIPVQKTITYALFSMQATPWHAYDSQKKISLSRKPA